MSIRLAIRISITPVASENTNPAGDAEKVPVAGEPERVAAALVPVAQ